MPAARPSLLDTPAPSWARDHLPDVDDDVVRTRVFWLIGLLVVLGFGVCVARGAAGPADPVVIAKSARSLVPGFTHVAFRVRPSPVHPSAEELAKKERCALLADTPEEHHQGLRGRKDLAGYDAMLFRFPTDVVPEFEMPGVGFDLSIAWFDAGGGFVGSAVMPVCRRDTCPTYSPPFPIRYALEVPKGDLGRLGAVRGSKLIPLGICGDPPARPSSGGARS